MSDEIGPTSVTLTNLFSDGFLNEREAHVYDNGKMQLVVYPAVSYRGSASREKVQQYVRDNVEFFYQDGTELKPVQWKKSFDSNEYEHDYTKGSESKASLMPMAESNSNIRTAIYFTVPKNSEGQKKWVAKLGDQPTTSNREPVVIYIQRYTKASKEDVEIADVHYIEDKDMTIRVLRYKAGAANVPNGHRLMRYLGNDGIKTSNVQGKESWCGNMWMPMVRKMPILPPIYGPFKPPDVKAMGGFVDYKDNFIRFTHSMKISYGEDQFMTDKRLDVYANGHNGHILLTSGLGAETQEMSEIEDAWNKGIVMALTKKFVLQGRKGMDKAFDLNYEITDPVTVEDNFGNEFKVTIKWDNPSEYKDFKDYYKEWTITEFKLTD